MSKIVTHRNPHLDEIACIWMIKKFLTGWSDARVSYIPTTPKGGNVTQPDADVNTMYIGVGRGKFDEHKGNLEDSATTLVYKFLTAEKKIKLAPLEKIALLELVEYINDDDHGRLINVPRSEYSAAVVMTYQSRIGKSSAEILAFGCNYFDGLFACLVEKAELTRDWKKATAFKTRWGAAFGIQTKVNAKMVLRFAATHGAILVIAVNPENKFRSFRALAESSVDLTKAYEIFRAREPKAEWYLHHSKRMLICGSDVAANLSLSRIPLTDLIAAIRV